MADFYSFMVTTHTFKVKDPEAFIRQLRELGVEDGNDSNCDGLSYYHEDDGTFWLGGYDASLVIMDWKKSEEIELEPIIQKHLALGEYASFQTVGYEKLRNVSGWVVVIAEKGSEYMDLDQAERSLKDKLGLPAEIPP